MFIECDDKKFYKRYIVTGFLFVGIFGTLFHFVYDWCRQARLIGLFVRVNESTWEHMKLLFIPMLIYIAICFQYVKKKVGCKYVSDKNSMKIFSKDSKISVNVKNEKNNEICKIIYTGLLGNIVGTWSISFLFYGYKGILGFEVAWIDISTFFIAVFIAFGLQYHILINSHKKQTMNCGKILLIVNLIQFIAFVLLTYHPLGFGIFVSPV